MKILINTIVVSAALLVGANAYAHTDAQHLSNCKAQVRAQYGDVDRIKIANINSKRTVFKAKLKVTNDGKRMLFNCEIREGTPIALSCLKGACEAQNLAAK